MMQLFIHGGTLGREITPEVSEHEGYRVLRFTFYDYQGAEFTVVYFDYGPAAPMPEEPG